jgi:hypothetical protein
MFFYIPDSEWRFRLLPQNLLVKNFIENPRKQSMKWYSGVDPDHLGQVDPDPRELKYQKISKNK